MDIEARWSAADIRAAIRTLVEANQIQEGLVRITVTAGDDGRGLGTTAITSRPLPDIPAQPALHIATSARRVSGPLSQCKSIARAAESVALRESRQEDAFDAILLNEKGRVVETTSRNLFVVMSGGIRTAPTYEGALPGITRAVVLELAHRLGLPGREATLTVDAVRRAEEVFLTGSGVGILGIASLDGHRYPAPGTLTQAISWAYADTLDSDSKW